ncbi:MAG: hypothetical protein WCI30_00010 [Clostridia bacterium]
MHIYKKILALLLIMSVCFSTTAFAVDYPALNTMGINIQIKEKATLTRLQLGELSLAILGRTRADITSSQDASSYNDLAITSKDFALLDLMVNTGVIVPDKYNNIRSSAPASYHELLKVTAKLLSLEPMANETVQQLAKRAGFLLYPNKLRTSTVTLAEAYATLEKASGSVYSANTGVTLLIASQMASLAKDSQQSYSLLSMNRAMLIFRNNSTSTTLPTITITTAAGVAIPLKSVRIANFANDLIIQPEQEFSINTNYTVTINGETFNLAENFQTVQPLLSAVQRISNNSLRLIFTNFNLDLDRLTTSKFSIVSQDGLERTIIGILPDYVYMEANNSTGLALRLITEPLLLGVDYTLQINQLATISGNPLTVNISLAQ